MELRLKDLLPRMYEKYPEVDKEQMKRVLYYFLTNIYENSIQGIEAMFMKKDFMFIIQNTSKGMRKPTDKRVRAKTIKLLKKCLNNK